MIGCIRGSAIQGNMPPAADFAQTSELGSVEARLVQVIASAAVIRREPEQLSLRPPAPELGRRGLEFCEPVVGSREGIEQSKNVEPDIGGHSSRRACITVLLPPIEAAASGTRCLRLPRGSRRAKHSTLLCNVPFRSFPNMVEAEVSSLQASDIIGDPGRRHLLLMHQSLELANCANGTY